MVIGNPNMNIDKYLYKVKGFNNESFDDLIMKSVPPKDIYFKEVFWKQNITASARKPQSRV